MAEDDETMGFGEEEEVRAPRARRKTAKYNSGDYVKTDEQDFEDEEEEEDDDESGRYAPRGRGGGGGGARGAPRRASAASSSRPKKSTKYCPSCEEVVRPSATVCEYCDYVFTSAARAQDEAPVSERFVFEPERVRFGLGLGLIDWLNGPVDRSAHPSNLTYHHYDRRTTARSRWR